MAREKFQTLTEQMFYVLLTLREECCGTDVMARISNLTQGRVTVGPGTLYNLLDSFQAAGWIMETKTEGRRRSYLITPPGNRPWLRNTSGCKFSRRITAATWAGEERSNHEAF